METNLAHLDDLGIKIPEISLPAPNIDIEKWSVVACDQWTQDRAYWEEAANHTAGSPSTLNLIFPEVYLNDEDAGERIAAIHTAMRGYLKDEHSENPILGTAHKGGVFVERETKHGVRRGVLICVDLEKYDWKHDSTSLIRATEDTIEERLPPRIKIRWNAPLECPHILLLIDDKEDLLMALFDKLLRGAPYVYRSSLMAGGGSVQGRLASRENDWAFIGDMLRHFQRKAITRSGMERAFLFAVGDGNHSLATAKAVWERYKAENSGKAHFDEQHPARYALVEVVNLYDPALRFEPIHRALLGTDIETALHALRASGLFRERAVDSVDELESIVLDDSAAKNHYGVFSRSGCTLLEAEGGKAATIDLEPVLQQIVREGHARGTAIDYIHGIDELRRVTKTRGDAVGIMLPPFRKDGLFAAIAEHGPLPRKSFSMGEPGEKRYYLECRKLFC